MSYLCKDLILKGENDRTHGGGLLNRRVNLLIHLKRLYLSLILKKVIEKEKNLTFPPYRLRQLRHLGNRRHRSARNRNAA